MSDAEEQIHFKRTKKCHNSTDSKIKKYMLRDEFTDEK